MNYEQIKSDVQEFKAIAENIGLSSYCFLGSLMLTCCLNDHGIKSELVKGYLIANDKYWALHIWNKIYLNDKVYQIDVTHNPLKKMGYNIQYTITLNDKWESLIDTEEEQMDHDTILKFYRFYQTYCVEDVLLHMSKKPIIHGSHWKMIFDRLSSLQTFKTIQKYNKILH